VSRVIPSHHAPDGRFRNPWPEAAGDDALRREVWRVAWSWWRENQPPDPPPGSFPLATPAPARPALGPSGGPALKITWIGHATALIQIAGLNLLTDPVWSDRSSPVGFAGPHRFVPPPLRLEELPEIHAVLLSHDHYDHLDLPTVRALRRRFGDSLTWYAPLGYRGWFGAQGIGQVVELDWWDAAPLPGGRFSAVCVPARHWTRRRPGGTNRRLWCGWVVLPGEGIVPDAPKPAAAPGSGPRRGPRVWFAGDTGYCGAFGEIGERLGPFDASLIPIGAYEPRWFMGAAHVNPEEAVRAYQDAGGRGAFVGIHWGTWRLTFEDPLEPPVRVRAAWAAAGLPSGDLHIPRHGETLELGPA
jgi:N-acyl-phosphatidylethanolamine-hydrolysing phospholipase D